MAIEHKNLYPEIPTCDDRLLWDTWLSMFHFPTLTVADELGLFSLLDQAPAKAEDIGKKLSLGARATEALLGVMTSLGYLVQLNGKFHLTEVSRNFLLPHSPYYWGGILHFIRNNPLSHSALLEAFRKDKATIYQDKDIWKAHEVDEEQARVFTRHMHSQTVAPAIGAAWRGDFEGVKRLLDVGGGSGAFCFPLTQRYPEMRCTILELPVVCKIAEEYISKAGLQDQIDTYSADFFQEPWPSGYDAVLFSNIFHDWSRERCIHLARRSFEILPSGGRIYLHEILLADTKDNPLVATSFSMCLFWITEGKQFTAGELTQILTECGFEDVSIAPTYGYYSLLCARKP
ncbi:MAG TPA: ubiquinone/menaquinone biosynthesis protein [Cyanobacteria bacterium UBA11162]|nr:ubiquinone/menaquinone biosynthesis protein [Cyanobacteria bacterium UBA11372]HBL11450.1 ubiquinone/menaquinone biosynthesis protein [Cyanobacteria bacterium UBA11162]